MKITKRTIKTTVAGLGLAALLLSAHATQPLKIDFSDETVGAEPKSFVSVVGVWRIESDGNNKVWSSTGGSGTRSSVKWIRNTPTSSKEEMLQ